VERRCVIIRVVTGRHRYALADSYRCSQLGVSRSVRRPRADLAHEYGVGAAFADRFALKKGMRSEEVARARVPVTEGVPRAAHRDPSDLGVAGCRRW